MDALLGTDFAVAEKNRLYRCMDRVLEHKQDLFLWLRQKWADLFQAEFEVLLYDLTSTYFEGAMEGNPKAKYGHSRDKRTDCLQVVIALVITTDGFPLAYEVMDGNTSDRATLRGFLDKIEKTYGKAKRMWVMDRGIPTEEILQEMRDPAREIFYLVGTPKGKIQQYEKKWLDLPWQKVRDSVGVKLFEQDGELYVLAKSEGRKAKETAMRRKRLARLLRKLRAMRRSLPSLVQLLMRLGAAKLKRAAHSISCTCKCLGKASRSRGRRSSFVWIRKNSRRRNGTTDTTCCAPTLPQEIPASSGRATCS
jgi:transposase